MNLKGVWDKSCAGFAAPVPTDDDDCVTISAVQEVASSLLCYKDHDTSTLRFTPPGQKEGSMFQVLKSDIELQRLREHKEAQSQKSGYPQNPCLYALRKVLTQAAALGPRSGNRAGIVMRRSGASYTAAAAAAVEAGTHTQSIQLEAQNAILDVHQTALWDRREELVVKLAIKQWAAQLALRHSKAEQNYRQEGGDGDFLFTSDLVEKTYPDYFASKMQQANNQAAISKSSSDGLAAKMGISQPQSDAACTSAADRAAPAHAAQPWAPAAHHFHSSSGKAAS